MCALFSSLHGKLLIFPWNRFSLTFATFFFSTHFCPKFTVLSIFSFSVFSHFLIFSLFRAKWESEFSRSIMESLDGGPIFIICKVRIAADEVTRLKSIFLFDFSLLHFSFHFALLPPLLPLRWLSYSETEDFECIKGGQFEIQQDRDQQLRWRWAKLFFLFCFTSIRRRRQVFFSLDWLAFFYIPLLYMRMIWLGSEQEMCVRRIVKTAIETFVSFKKFAFFFSFIKISLRSAAR